MATMRAEVQELQGCDATTTGRVESAAAAGVHTAEQERADTARIAGRVAARADDGDTLDNEALGQPLTYAGRKDTDFAESDHKVRIWEPGWETRSLVP